jgi:YD repeat-containing protein
VNYAFDYLQRPIQVTGDGVGTLASYVWDGIGDLTAIDRGNGANTSYAYDGDDRLSGLTHDFTNSAADVAWTFSYDAGNGLLGRASPSVPLAKIAVATYA